MTRGRLPDLHRFVGALQSQGASLAQGIADDVRQFAPVYSGPDPSRTGGAYQAGIEGEAEATEGGLVVRIKGAAPLTDWIIEGTEPHEIAAVAGSRLRFYVSGGTIVFAPLVHHPGTAPNPFPLQATDLVFARIVDAVTAAVAEAMAA